MFRSWSHLDRLIDPHLGLLELRLCWSHLLLCLCLDLLDGLNIFDPYSGILLLRRVKLVGESDGIDARFVAVQVESDATGLPQIVDEALLVHSILAASHCQGVAIRTETDALDREGSSNLLDDELVMDVVKDDLTIKANRAHEELIQRTEAEAFHMTCMLVELGKDLFSLDIIEADSTMIRHCSKHVLLQVTKLSLVNRPRVVLSSKLAKLLELSEFELRLKEDTLGPVEVDETSLV